LLRIRKSPTMSVSSMDDDVITNVCTRNVRSTRNRIRASPRDLAQSSATCPALRSAFGGA
jgi:hypothetical protein